jgi:hypothetical protein
VTRRFAVLALALAAAGPAWGALARVNNVSGYDFSGSSLSTSATFAHAIPTMAVTAGNQLVVNVVYAGNAGVTISDPVAGNTWTTVASGVAPNGNRIYQFQATNVAGSAVDQILVTYPSGGGSYTSVVVTQYSGELTSGAALDASASKFQLVATSITSGAFTTSQANEVVVCAGSYADTGATAGTVNGNAMSINAFDSPNKILVVEDVFLNAVQTGVTASMSTTSGAELAGFVCGTYKSSVTAAPPTISKSFGAGFVYTGSGTSLSFTVTNPNAAQSLSSVGFSDTLPSGLVVATPNGLTGSCGGGTISATAGGSGVSLASATLASSTSCTFSVNVLSSSTGTRSNVTGNVTSTEGGSGGTASASLVVVSTTPTLSTIRTGNWSDTSTATSPWCNSTGTCATQLVGHGAGGVPGYQDKVAVTSGATLTCDQSPCIYGTSSASGNELTVASGGAFVVGASHALTMRGNMTVGDSGGAAALTFGAGSTVTCDTSLAPAATAYTITVGYAYQTPSLFSIPGTSGSRATFTSTYGGNAPCYLAAGTTTGLSISWSYADLSYLYSASNSLLTGWGPNGGGSADMIVLLNNTFNTVGSMQSIADNLDPAATLNVQNNNWANSVDSFTISLGGSASTPGGTRIISNNVFDKQPNFYNPLGTAITGNTFLNKVQFVSVMPPTFSGNLLQTADGGNAFGGNGVLATSTLDNNYYYIGPAATGDPHIIQILGTGTVATVTNSIADGANSVGANQEGAFTNGDDSLVSTGNILLPDASGHGLRMTGYLGSASTRVSSTHDTYFSTNYGVRIGECGGSCPPYSWTGMITSVHYANVWGPASPTGFIAGDLSGTLSNAVTDAASASGLDYNNGWRLSTGTCSNGSTFACAGYQNFVFSSGSPGVHDTHVNPNFVCATCNLLTWDASLGGPGTYTHVMAMLAARNTPAFNSAYSIPAAMAYVRAAMAPQNPAVCNMDGAGNYAGAVPCVLATAGAVVCLGFCPTQRVP